MPSGGEYQAYGLGAGQPETDDEQQTERTPPMPDEQLLCDALLINEMGAHLAAEAVVTTVHGGYRITRPDLGLGSMTVSALSRIGPAGRLVSTCEVIGRLVELQAQGLPASVSWGECDECPGPPPS